MRVRLASEQSLGSLLWTRLPQKVLDAKLLKIVKKKRKKRKLTPFENEPFGSENHHLKLLPSQRSCMFRHMVLIFKYSHGPHNDVLVNDRPRAWQ